MLLLVIDTSGKHGSVALANADESTNEVRLIEEIPLAGGTFSAQLIPQIAALLSTHSFGKADLGTFIVVSGPGSFTGLRVGLAAIKALGEILERPIVPVSLLEVIARESGGNGNVLAILDAGRGEVYAGVYEIANGESHLVREELLSKDEIFPEVRSSMIVTPDASLAAMPHAGLSVRIVSAPSAAKIARLGWQKLRAGAAVAPVELEANYIRRSDAEIFARPASRS